MTDLVWNNDTRCYEAHFPDGDSVQVDGDAFAEAEEEMREKLIKDGTPPKEAEQKAWEELRSAEQWCQKGLDRVTFTPVS